MNRWAFHFAILVLILSGLPSTRAHAQTACVKKYVEDIFTTKWNKAVPEQVRASVENRKAWNTQALCTRPEMITDTDRQPFRFLVRTVMDHYGTWENRTRGELLNMLDSIGHSPQPRILSTSLIDERQTHTIGNVGVILETNGDHVQATFSADGMTQKLRSEWGGFKNADDEFAAALLETKGISTPENTMTYASGSATMPWNEIVLLDVPGTTEKIRVSGLVYFYTDSKASYLDELKKIAQDRGLPLLVIKKR